MNDRHGNGTPNALVTPAELVARLDQAGFGALPDSEIPAVTEAWDAICMHAARIMVRNS